MAGRPNFDEAMESISERVEYAICLAAEAFQTPDDEDENGEPLNPIHNYAEAVVNDTIPIAILGICAAALRASASMDDKAIGGDG